MTSLHRAAHINKLAFDTVKDLTPIIRVGGYLYGILVKPDSKLKTLKDLIEYAKANPGQLSYMASGIGTGGHIAAEEMATNAGVKFNHLPSKGDQESSAALLGGHVDFISTTSGWIPLVEAGQLKLMATYGETRVKRFPDVPTVKEVGLQGGARFSHRHRRSEGDGGRTGQGPARCFPESLKRPGFLKAMAAYEMPVLYQNTADFAKFWADAYVEAGEQVKNFINIEENLPHHLYGLGLPGPGGRGRSRPLGLRHFRPAGAGIPALSGGDLLGRAGWRRPHSNRCSKTGRKSRQRVSRSRTSSGLDW